MNLECILKQEKKEVLNKPNNGYMSKEYNSHSERFPNGKTKTTCRKKKKKSMSCWLITLIQGQFGLNNQRIIYKYIWVYFDINKQLIN